MCPEDLSKLGLRNFKSDSNGSKINFVVEKCIPTPENKFEGCEPDQAKINQFLKSLYVNLFVVQKQMNFKIRDMEPYFETSTWQGSFMMFPGELQIQDITLKRISYSTFDNRLKSFFPSREGGFCNIYSSNNFRYYQNGNELLRIEISNGNLH